VTGPFLIPAPWPPEDPKVRALGKRWLRLSPRKRAEWMHELLATKSPDLDLLLSAFNQRNPDPQDAAQAMAHHLVERRHWALLHLMCRHFASVDDMPPDPTAVILADLYGLLQFRTEPGAHRLLSDIIATIEDDWKRPPGYEGMTFE
jgi:hypothetical protein